MIKPILQRKAYTLRDALNADRRNSKNCNHSVPEEMEDVAFVDLNNGQSLVLT